MFFFTNLNFNISYVVIHDKFKFEYSLCHNLVFILKRGVCICTYVLMKGKMADLKKKRNQTE